MPHIWCPGACELSSFVPTDNEIAICNICDTDELCDDHKGGWSSEQEEKKDEREPEPAPSFT